MAEETFLTPLINRDLIGPANTPMGQSLGLGMGGYNPYMHTNYLGGITMTGPLAYDVYGGVQRSQYKNLNGLKNAGIAIGGFIAACVAGSKLNKLFKAIGKVFK